VFKKGAAILSIHLQVPLVPVAIDGFYEAWPRGRKFQKFAPLKIEFGDPIYPPPESEASAAAYEQLTAELKQRVVRIWNELRQAQSAGQGTPSQYRWQLFIVLAERLRLPARAPPAGLPFFPPPRTGLQRTYIATAIWFDRL
jgi:hypothetical protein